MTSSSSPSLVSSSSMEKAEPEIILSLRDITRIFPQPEGSLSILKGIHLSLKKGELVALVGQSGSGKSTLLQIAGLLEPPSSGTLSILGQEIGRTSDQERTALRRQHMGFVYQFHHLLPEFSALENVMMPLLIANRSPQDSKEKALALLESLGLGHRLSHRPQKLSGGEQQRVAIARALANGPALLLADEPTGNLDNETADQVFEYLLKLIRNTQVSALIATHNPNLAARMDRVVLLKEGKLTDPSLSL